MSADLWAAFGEGPKEESSTPWAQSKTQSQQSQATQPSFSAFPSTVPSAASLPSINPRKEQLADDDSDADSWSAVNQELEDAWRSPAAAPTWSIQPQPQVDLIDDDDFGDFEDPEETPEPAVNTSAPAKPSAQPVQNNPLEADDDFGDFEDAEIEGSQSKAELSVGTGDLPMHASSSGITRGTEDVFKFENTSEQKPTSTAWDPFADLEQLAQPSQPAQTAQSHSNSGVLTEGSRVSNTKDRKAPLLEGIVMAEEHPDPNEKWDDFSEPVDIMKDLPPKPPGKSDSSKPSDRNKTNMKPKGANSTPKQEEPAALPPTNVPPPSVLMPMISSIIQELPEEIDSILQSHEDYEGGVSALTQALGVLTALEDRLSVVKVAARIIAGRKLRWKRDTILAQSMKIGAAGRSGGMKLAGVDKAEVRREDREVSEFVRVWKQNLGRMRAAIAKLPAQIDDKPPLPHIAETILVRTLRERDGAVTAPKCCVICGLKRDERVDKVDGDVWDQFGEFWTDHWGHTECRTFWTTHEQFLQQR